MKMKLFFAMLPQFPTTWWRHQMETFSTLPAICAGNSSDPGEFPTQRPVTRSFDVYFDLRPNTRLSKQLWGWWFVTQSHSLWRHRNDLWRITHWYLVIHSLFRQWLAACSMPSHYLKQCSLITLQDKLQGNLNQNTMIFTEGNRFRNFRKMLPFSLKS